MKSESIASFGSYPYGELYRFTYSFAPPFKASFPASLCTFSDPDICGTPKEKETAQIRVFGYGIDLI